MKELVMFDWLPLHRNAFIGSLLLVLSACGDPAISFSDILENGVKVKMIKVQGSKLAIDTHQNILQARKILK